MTLCGITTLVDIAFKLNNNSVCFINTFCFFLSLGGGCERRNGMDHSCSTFVTGYSSTFGAAGLWIASHINPTAQKSCKVAIFILICHSIHVPTIVAPVICYEYCNILC
jgi:hypothetical protein